MRKLRDLKKFGKKVQQEVTLKRAKEKREMLDQVKKIRKGHGGNLDFLQRGADNVDMNEEGPNFKRKNKQNVKNDRGQRSAVKRNYKDKKFGFGGKKKGSKMNNKESVNDISGYRRPQNASGKGGKHGMQGPKKQGGKNKRNQRYGKMRRQKAKHGKR